LTYANQAGVQGTLLIGVETRAGEPNAVTFNEEGPAALDAALATIRAELGDNFGGIAIHNALDSYLNPDWRAIAAAVDQTVLKPAGDL